MTKHQCAAEFYAPLDVYDDNYQQLMALLPPLASLHLSQTYALDGPEGLVFEVLERTRYTSVLRLSACWPPSSPWLLAPEMSVRLYHDAGVAEVMCYQNQQGFKADYDYPNPRMLNRREKRRLNEFLRDWLAVYLARTFMDDAEGLLS